MGRISSCVGFDLHTNWHCTVDRASTKVHIMISFRSTIILDDAKRSCLSGWQEHLLVIMGFFIDPGSTACVNEVLALAIGRRYGTGCRRLSARCTASLVDP